MNHREASGRGEASPVSLGDPERGEASGRGKASPVSLGDPAQGPPERAEALFYFGPPGARQSRQLHSG